MPVFDHLKPKTKKAQVVVAGGWWAKKQGKKKSRRRRRRKKRQRYLGENTVGENPPHESLIPVVDVSEKVVLPPVAPP